jgi:hypothetical protein
MRPAAPEARRLALPMMALGAAAILLVQDRIALTVVTAAVTLAGWLLVRAARSLRRAGQHIDTILAEELSREPDRGDPLPAGATSIS